MRVHVLLKDIQNGKTCKHNACPIALAIKRQTKGAVSVVPRFVVMKNGEIKHISLPGKARKFVLAFDQGYDVSPIRFDLTEEYDERYEMTNSCEYAMADEDSFVQ